MTITNLYILYYNIYLDILVLYIGGTSESFLDNIVLLRYAIMREINWLLCNRHNIKHATVKRTFFYFPNVNLRHVYVIKHIPTTEILLNSKFLNNSNYDYKTLIYIIFTCSLFH